ncbi:MAG: hypothetical protein LBN34_02870 [Clostridiales Family XIII bacterium]|jgi:hypothetical protein|nr:hypothetical protein [Clostridiales Family XIII bacterium]
MRNSIRQGKSRSSIGQRASAAFLTVVLLVMAIVPQMAMATDMEEISTGGVLV